jgi:hypothetical protein
MNNIYNTILKALRGELNRDGQITRAKARVKKALLRGVINCSHGIRVEHDRKKQRLRVLAPDPLESYYAAYFALTFSFRDDILYVALERDGRQIYRAFPEGDEYWDNETNCFPLCQSRVCRGNRSLDIAQWAHHWVEDFLDHYFSYAGV